MPHDLNCCQKLPGIILVTSTNFISKNTLLSQNNGSLWKSEKRKNSYLLYRASEKKNSLTESRDSRSFFILKICVHYSFWAIFNFSFSIPAKCKRIIPTKGPMDDFDFPFFSYTRVPSFMPPFIFGVVHNQT